MEKLKIKYFLLGLVFMLFLMIVISSTSDSNSDKIGKYQITAYGTENYSGVFVLDTETGVVKCVYKSPRSKQLGISFEKMADTVE